MWFLLPLELKNKAICWKRYLLCAPATTVGWNCIVTSLSRNDRSLTFYTFHIYQDPKVFTPVMKFATSKILLELTIYMGSLQLNGCTSLLICNYLSNRQPGFFGVSGDSESSWKWFYSWFEGRFGSWNSKHATTWD